MLKTNLNFSAPIKIFLKKQLIMLFLGALVSTQNAAQAGDSIGDSSSAASTTSRSITQVTAAPRMVKANPRFIEAILREYDVFKRRQSGVATPADFFSSQNRPTQIR